MLHDTILGRIVLQLDFLWTQYACVVLYLSSKYGILVSLSATFLEVDDINLQLRPKSMVSLNLGDKTSQVKIMFGAMAAMG